MKDPRDRRIEELEKLVRLQDEERRKEGKPLIRLPPRPSPFKKKPSKATVRKLRRDFIKTRLKAGDSPKTIRTVFNALAGMSPEDIDRRWGYHPRTRSSTTPLRWLSGQPPLSAKELHSIRRNLSKRDRAEMITLRRGWRELIHGERGQIWQYQNGYRRLPPEPDPQLVHDAAILYRATGDESYREVFTEGSP